MCPCLSGGAMSPYKTAGGPLGGGERPLDIPATLCSSSCPLPADSYRDHRRPPPPPSTVTSTMDSSRMFRAVLCVGLLSALCHCQASKEVSAEELGAERPELSTDRDLIEALEALLSRVQTRLSSTEKRGVIPVCGMGERCAMRFGPRIGKLCDCGRGSNCNSYLLKCI
ncbi:cocaine- and amphetamine-regulated transcript-like [Genypterus blacodes]|uniref:cocaine- and amphetamine-regulated transcript-like n=1 Tax=Genypterus blacodes TaxID=154954 RepID=UPI003F766FEF